MIDHQSSFYRGKPHCSRRGSAYLLILLTALLIAVIGFSAITLGQIERRQTQTTLDAADARAAARAAIEYGFLKIRTETSWANLSTGSATWASSVPFNGGTFSLTRTAYDNSDPLNDRLTLVAVGTHGEAVYQLRVVIVGGRWVDSQGWTQVVN